MIPSSALSKQWVSGLVLHEWSLPNSFHRQADRKHIAIVGALKLQKHKSAWPRPHSREREAIASTNTGYRKHLWSLYLLELLTEVQSS